MLTMRMDEMTITRNTTRWAIAAKVPVDTLERVRAKLPKLLRGNGSKVFAGDAGFNALLVFGENADEGESAATQLSRDTGAPVYLLDFDDDAPFIKELAKGRERRKRGHPADFLEERGIAAPGHAPAPSAIVSVGVIEDLTPAEARKVIPKLSGSLFHAHPRGTLVTADGFTIVSLVLKAKRLGYVVDVDRSNGAFTCNIVGPGPVMKQFAPTSPSAEIEHVDSILGETTLDGILRVLEIPRELLP
jgi:hypothetical protein